MMFIFQSFAEPFEPPMDLVTVRQNLEQDAYDNPIELFKDVQLIFVYAKAFSPNKRTKVCFAIGTSQKFVKK